MKQYNLKTDYKLLLGDTITPVSIYLKLRDRFPNSFLLESSDYHGNEDIYSYICCKPIAGIKVENNTIHSFYPDGQSVSQKIEQGVSVGNEIEKFTTCFKVQHNNFPFITSGVFGYTAYDAIRYFEEIDIKTYETDFRKIPDIQYNVFQFIIAFNHFNNEVYVFENKYAESTSTDNVDSILSIIQKSDFPQYKFSLVQREESNFNDEEFLRVLEKGKEHCRRGDVFQIVLSRRFSRQYKGDDFNVYRSLRSVNPSPYLFYFDYGSFRIFGSSPEAQIVVKNDKATIYPIAGTFRRSGDDTRDAQLAEQLLNDPKENSEHVMLVDLARNDLSRHCSEVQVETFKEIQYYSHVIHLVSKVTGKLPEDHNFMGVVGDTFPAGTLSGAPKHSAMQLINRYEHGNRGFYGGCIGFMSFKGEFNHAIMIRSIMSKDNVLYYQAGAGVVDLSKTESELQEVNNKLAALKKAIIQAEHI